MFATPPVTAVTVLPVWNKKSRELTFDGVLVKRYRTHANTQIAILDAFQKLGWSQNIPDPLSSGRKWEPSDHTHNTLVRLNGCQQGPAHIKFGRDGDGKLIWWIVETGQPPRQENSVDYGE